MLSMSSRSKVVLAITIPILIFLIVLLYLVEAVYKEPEEPISYPTGALAQSVFVQQNNVYTANESLTLTHEFKNVPYKVDLPEGTAASLSTGTVYQLADGIFVYLSEYDDTADINSIIYEQFPVALLMDYIPEYTQIVQNVVERGYINGFSGQYLCETITASNGATSVSACLIGYAVDISDEGYVGNHILVSIGNTDISTESLNTYSSVLTAIMNTLRKDEDLEKQMAEAKEQEVIEQQEAAAEASSEEVIDDGMTNNTDNYAEVVASGLTTEIPINIPTGYTEFELTVTWTDYNPNAVLELFFPDGTSFAEPVSQTETSAVFALDKVEAGDYSLHVLNYDACGSISTTVAGVPTQ